MNGMKSEIHAHPCSLEPSVLICEEFDDNQLNDSYQLPSINKLFNIGLKAGYLTYCSDTVIESDYE